MSLNASKNYLLPFSGSLLQLFYVTAGIEISPFPVSAIVGRVVVSLPCRHVVQIELWSVQIVPKRHVISSLAAGEEILCTGNYIKVFNDF